MLTDNKITAWTNPVVNEADRPQRSASDMKAIFDSNSNQLMAALNGLIESLIAATAASEIGAEGGSVQSRLDALRQAVSDAITECKTYTDNASFAAGAADMRTAVYDPQGIRADVYAYAEQKAQTEAGKRAAPSVTYYAEVPASGWSAVAPCTQTVTVAGMAQPHTTPLAGVLLSDNAETAIAEQEAWNVVGRVEVEDGVAVLTCFEDKPETSFTLRLVVIG